MRDRRPGEQLDRHVVVDHAIGADDATVAARRVRAQADVGEHEQFGVRLLDRTHRELGHALVVVGTRAELVLDGGHAEDHHRGHTELERLAGLLDRRVDRHPIHARHRLDRRPGLLPELHEHRIDEVGRSELGLADQAAKRAGCAQSPHSGRWKRHSCLSVGVHQIWLTAIGKDKPGIVARIAKVLVDHGLNIEDSQMRILGGRFAMMLLLRGSASEEALYKDLLATGRQLGLDYIYVHPIADADVNTPKPTHMASLYGADRPGQVAAVAERLAALDVNISGLSTRLEGNASVLEVELTVPEGLDIRSELTAIAHDRGIRLELADL